jgi:hypothetical protein
VREAVVVARSSGGDGSAKRLVAYVSPRPDVASGELDPREVQAWLGRSLPASMVPAQLLVLERLPLSPNGKVERRALPAPEALSAERPYVAPETDAERALAEIWAAVLDRPRVGAHDDFFELGGDSITTLQVIARAASRGLTLTPKLVFENPRLCDAARAAVQNAASTASSVGPQQTSIPSPAPAVALTPPSAPQAQLSREEWDELLTELES